EEFVSDAALSYMPEADLAGKYGPVRVDFLVYGLKMTSAVLGLSSSATSLAHQSANEVFRKWFDLDLPERKEQKLTLLDDRVRVYKDEDIARLESLSRVIPFSDKRAIAEALAA